jgi:predicted DNA-binding transcriptional regulator AlpA
LIPDFCLRPVLALAPMSASTDFSGRRFLRFKELREIGIAPSRTTLERWVAEGRFPAPVRLGPRVLVWDTQEIQRLLTTLKETA